MTFARGSQIKDITPLGWEGAGGGGIRITFSRPLDMLVRQFMIREGLDSVISRESWAMKTAEPPRFISTASVMTNVRL